VAHDRAALAEALRDRLAVVTGPPAAVGQEAAATLARLEDLPGRCIETEVLVHDERRETHVDAIEIAVPVSATPLPVSTATGDIVT
jgi:hypothetical protein